MGCAASCAGTKHGAAAGGKQTDGWMENGMAPFRDSPGLCQLTAHTQPWPGLGGVPAVWQRDFLPALIRAPHCYFGMFLGLGINFKGGKYFPSS